MITIIMKNKEEIQFDMNTFVQEYELEEKYKANINSTIMLNLPQLDRKICISDIDILSMDFFKKEKEEEIVPLNNHNAHDCENCENNGDCFIQNIKERRGK